MASEVAWLDYDEEQQRRTQMMLDALSERTAVDELGLGVLRDLIAGTLHPGMTVLLTRARYLLLVPWAYRDLVGSTSEAVLRAGRTAEIRTARALVEHYRSSSASADDTGIIGRRALDDTKRLASTAYWPLLRRLGILTADGSVADYCRARASILDDRRKRQPFLTDDEATPERTYGWMELPEQPTGSDVSFELSRGEAEFLRQRFLTSEDPKGTADPRSTSLVRWLLDDGGATWVTGLARVWDHPLADRFPEHTVEVMRLGEGLDRMVHGARILYNALCARDARNDDLADQYREQMAAWLDEIEEHDYPAAFPLNRLFQWATTALGPRATGGAGIRLNGTRLFVERWRDLVGSKVDLFGDAGAARLITQREAGIKPGRARLSDRALLANWQGDSGIGRFDYNWVVTRRMLRDIHQGVGTEQVGAADFVAAEAPR